MNDLTTSSGNNLSLKDVFNRPGGGFAKITGIAALGGLGYVALKYAVPFLVMGLSNVLILCAEMAALAGILFLATNKEFKNGIALAWFQLMRGFYGSLVRIDPISVMKRGIGELRNKMEIVNKSVTDLQAVLIKMTRNYESYKRAFEDNVRKRDALNNKVSKMDRNNPNAILPYQSQLQLLNNTIARGAEQIAKQKSRIQQSEQYLDIMKKVQIAADFQVKDSEDKLKYLEEDYEQSRAQQSAVSAISAIMKGGLTKSLEEEMAYDYITNTIAASNAEIERLIDGSNDILVNYELNNDINSEKVALIVDDFNKNGFAIFDSKPTSTIVSNLPQGNENKPVDVKAEPVVETKRRYI